MGGLGIADPHTYMGVSQLETFISNTWQKTPMGTLLEVAMNDLALELGLPTPWYQEQLHIGMLYARTHSWIHHMVQFTLEHDIKINFTTTGTLSSQQTHDRTIMEVAAVYHPQAVTLQSINRIRMALNVVWLSDVGTADGQYLEQKWLYPLQCPMQCNSFCWPQKHHTTQQDWRIW